MKSVCVYLGANFGNENEYRNSAVLLGAQIAVRNLTLVYGGSSLGMMGILANIHLLSDEMLKVSEEVRAGCSSA